MSKNKMINSLCNCAIFLALLIVATFIKIPIPGDFITLQLEAVILIGIVLGTKLGTLVCLLFVLMGLCGIPIFAGGGGFGYIFTPTFGYMIGFIITPMVIGFIANKVKNHQILFGIILALIGILIIYIFGYIHKYVLYNFYLKETMYLKEIILATLGFYLPKDLILGGIVGVFAFKLKNIYLKINHPYLEH